MSIYTSEQADYLIKYYSKIIVGKTLEQSTNTIIEYINKEHIGNNNYHVIVVGKMIKGFIIPKRRIENVAKNFNLPLPTDVLRDQNL